MIELKNIGKKYAEAGIEKWVLKDVNVSFPSKGLVAVKGESGSGKSTLLNILSLQEKMDEGTLRINGRNAEKLTDKEKEDLRLFEYGFIYQHFNLFDNMTAFENVKLGLDIRGDNSKTNTEAVNAIFYKYGLNDLKDKECSVLSGGEKQRIAFLRAIIRNPRIILADEPTGALDSKNEKLIMESLKEYSKDHLVLMVSHNLRVIKKYADIVYKVEQGNVTIETKIRKKKELENNERKERGKDKTWMLSLIKKRLKEDWKRNLLSFLGSFVSISGLLISLGFISSSKEALAKEKKNSLLYTMASVSIEETYEIEGSPLSLTRTERPTKDSIFSKFGDNVTIENDYSFFMPSYSAYFLNGEPLDPVQFSPISDISLGNRPSIEIVEGTLPSRNSLEYVLVNREFASLFQESVIQHEIKIENSVTVEVDGIEDELQFEFRFYVAAVVEEFSFLNSPRVYYPAYSLRSYFDRMNLENISASKGVSYDVLDLLDETEGDSPYSSYSYNIFFDESYAPTVERESKRSHDLVIRSQAFEVADSFSQLIDSFSIALIPFLVLIVVASIAITCFTAHSLFLSKRKESAILFALGCRANDVSNILLYESILVCGFSGILSLLITFPLSRYLSHVLYLKTMIKNLVNINVKCLGIPGLPILVVLIVSLSLPVIGMVLPNWMSKRNSLVKELADE